MHQLDESFHDDILCVYVFVFVFLRVCLKVDIFLQNLWGNKFLLLYVSYHRNMIVTFLILLRPEAASRETSDRDDMKRDGKNKLFDCL